MSLQLDARQRAMLEEMGVRLFLREPVPPLAQAQQRATTSAASLAAAGPVPVPAAAPAVSPESAFAPAASLAPTPRPPSVAAALPASAAGPLPAPDGLPDVAALGWDALAETAAALAGPARMVFGSGDRGADWLLVGEPLTEEEELDGTPFAGQAGKLLDNMLAALGLNRRQGVYLTNVVKARPPARGLQPQDLAAWEAILRRQVELLQPRVILAMGRFPLQTLLRSSEPLGRMRGQPHAYQGVPVVVTYAPGYLLRALPDKARAWADLCLARSLLA